MNQNSIPQYAAIEQPFGVEFTPIHCPICGQSTIDIEAGHATPCPHLAFIYIGDIGDFEYQSDAFQQKWQSLDIDVIEFKFDDFNQYLQQAGYDNKLLAIEITGGGMACGPIWHTDVFGFDYSTLADEQDDSRQSTK